MSIIHQITDNIINLMERVSEIDILETTYNYILKVVLGIANPIKKSIIKTQCKTHKLINIGALRILKNDKYLAEYNFFGNHVNSINKGTVWADQDFKSSNHFYNPSKKKGLYGRKSAMDLGVDYYSRALKLWETGEFNKSLFYLGAALHIIQDMTIPQHANIHLLKNHRQYESYIKRSYEYLDDFKVERGAYLLDSIENYIKFNAKVAIKIYNEFNKIKNNKSRYYRISKCGIPLAKRTTAGAMIMFYKEIKS